MTIALSEQYPKLIRDFFLFDKGEQTYPKDIKDYNDILCSGVAHMPIQLPWEISSNDLLEEAKALNYHHKKGKYSWIYGAPGTIEDKYAPKVNVASQSSFITPRPTSYSIKTEFNKEDKIPFFGGLIIKLNELVTVTDVIVKKLKPTDYMEPHIDNDINPWKIYIPLNWPDRNYFKLFKKGFIPMKPGQPTWINVGEHPHSVVNDSSEDRYIISIYADWHTESWKKIVENSYKKLIT